MQKANKPKKKKKRRRKKEIRSFFNTTHKNKLKMDYRPKCETRHY